MAQITSFEDYFQRMDKEVFERLSLDYPKLTKYYASLKEAFEGLEELEPFQMLRQVLATDAQIQILIDYLRLNLLDSYSEETLIQQIIEDSHCYYREITGLRLSDPLPLGILYLGDRVA